MALQGPSQGALPTRPCPVPTEPWEIAKNRFLDGLPDNEKALFRYATLENLFYTASVAHNKYESESKMRKWQQKLKPLVDALESYGKALDVYSNSSSMFLCPIWGSVRVVLSIAQAFDKYFENLVEMFAQIGDVLPRFRIYEHLFPDHSELIQALSDAYLEIISFCTEAKRTFTKMKRASIGFSTSRRALWKGFEGAFETSLSSFRRHDRQVTKCAEVANMAECKKQRELDKRSRKAERRRKALALLSSLDHESQHGRIRRHRHPGTGVWIWDHDAFKQCLDAPTSSCFCCFGIPGSGKTFLASSVVDAMLRHAGGRTIAVYQYCDYADQATLTARAVIGTLTKQLLQGAMQKSDRHECEEKPLGSLMEEVYHNFVDRMTEPSIDELQGLLIRAISCYGKVFVILDGVDEMHKDDQIIILKIIRGIVDSSKAGTIAKAFLTSRYEETHIRKSLAGYPHVDLSPDNVAKDIQVYVEDIVKEKVRSQVLQFRNPALEKEIVEALVSGGKDMFLWVKLQLEEICEADSDAGIRDTLRNLPGDLPGTFIRILKKIAASTGGQKKSLLAQKAFRWIACARRPLNIAELNEAVAILPTDKRLELDRIPNDDTYLLQACGNLVICDRTDGSVRFAHYTVQQFLLSPCADDAEYDKNFHISRHLAEVHIGELCLAYLHFADFETQLTKIDQASSRVTLDPPVVIRRVLDNQTSTTAKATKLLVGVSRSIGAPARKLQSIRMGMLQPLAYESPSEILRQKYSLLDYVLEFWVPHTSDLSAANPYQWSKYIDLVLNRQLLFPFRPWESSRGTDRDPATRLFQYAIGNQQLALLRVLEDSYMLRDLFTTWSKIAAPLVDTGCRSPLAYACQTGLVEVVKFLVSAYGGTLIYSCHDAYHLLAAADHASDELLDIIVPQLRKIDDELDHIVLEAIALAIERDAFAEVERLLSYTGPTARVASDEKLLECIKLRLRSRHDETKRVALSLSLHCIPYTTDEDEDFIVRCLGAAIELSDADAVALILKRDIPIGCVESALSRIAKSDPTSKYVKPMIMDMLLQAGAGATRYIKASYQCALESAVVANNKALVRYLLDPSFNILDIAAAASIVLPLAVRNYKHDQNAHVVIRTLVSCSGLRGKFDAAALYTSLSIAVDDGWPEAADTLIDEVSTENVGFATYQTYLVGRAAGEGKVQLLAYLLNYGAAHAMPLEWNNELKKEFVFALSGTQWTSTLRTVLRACTNIDDRERMIIVDELLDYRSFLP